MSRTGLRVPLGAIELPGGDRVPVEGQGFGPLSGPVAVVLAGLHGDAAEGVAAAMALEAHWSLHPPSRSVLVFGCLNPLAVLHGSHRWPGLDVDFAARLPGDAEGHAPDRIAAALFEHLRGASRVVELGASDPCLWEAVYAEAWGDAVVPGMPVPWVRHPGLAPSGSPGAWGAVRLRGGRTGRVHPEGVRRLVEAVLAWVDGPETAQVPVVLHDVLAEEPGVFVPLVRPGAAVQVDTVMGTLQGNPVRAGAAGVSLALRDKPAAHMGSVLARIAVAR